MSLDHLWAAWRSDYVNSMTSGAPGEAGAGTVSAITAAEGECVFCVIAASPLDDAERHVVHEDELTMSVLNAYPYASGHLLVMPTRHLSDPDELDEVESLALWAELGHGLRAVKRAYSPDGVNVGANLGRAGGAGIPGHLHFHVLPRWVGDTNFMTTIASVRVLPEALSETFAKLKAAWPD